jgi:hypothetical protein
VTSAAPGVEPTVADVDGPAVVEGGAGSWDEVGEDEVTARILRSSLDTQALAPRTRMHEQSSVERVRRSSIWEENEFMPFDGWIAPEFEPDHRNRVRTVPTPVAWIGGAFVALLVLGMVAVATHSYFSPSLTGPGPSSIEVSDGAASANGAEVLGLETSSTALPAGVPDNASTSTTRGPGQTPTPTDQSPAPAGSGPVVVPPARATPPVSTGTTVAPPTTVPVTPPVIPIPVASRSETQCPVVSVAKGATRATVLLVNLRSSRVSVDINGGRIDLPADGCQTLTVDALLEVGVGPDDLTVVGADPSCTVTVSGSLVDPATSYEMQVRDTPALCGEEAVPDIKIFEAVLWRATPPSEGAPGAP